jgi:anti-anti-sigma factor
VATGFEEHHHDEAMQPEFRPGATVTVDVDDHHEPRVSVVGELDITNTHLLHDAITGLDLDGARSIRIDLSGLTFCDASTVSALIRADRRVRAAGGRLVITGASGVPLRVLTLTGIHHQLHRS